MLDVELHFLGVEALPASAFATSSWHAHSHGRSFSLDGGTATAVRPGTLAQHSPDGGCMYVGVSDKALLPAPSDVSMHHEPASFAGSRSHSPTHHPASKGTAGFLLSARRVTLCIMGSSC